MCAPFFRAAQQTSHSPFAQTTITLPRLEIEPHEFHIGAVPKRFYLFTHVTVSNGEPYTPAMPSVRWFARMVAIPVDKRNEPLDDPHWFSIHLYWDVVHRDGLARWNCPRPIAIVKESHERVSQYLKTHPYPAYSEEYDPIVLEIW